MRIALFQWPTLTSFTSFQGVVIYYESFDSNFFVTGWLKRMLMLFCYYNCSILIQIFSYITVERTFICGAFYLCVDSHAFASPTDVRVAAGRQLEDFVFVYFLMSSWFIPRILIDK